MRHGTRQRDSEPFAAALRRGGEAGRRQAQRGAHRMIARASRLGFPELADWLTDGFRSGELTDDGAAGDPTCLARTLAAVTLFEFVEHAAAGRPAHGAATLVFEESDARRRGSPPLVTRHELRGIPRGELHGTLLASAFGMSATDTVYHLRHFNIDEFAPEPQSVAGQATLDAWDALAPEERVPALPSGPAEYRVRMGWSDGGDDVRIARLCQKLRGAEFDRPEPASPRLRLDGPPVLEMRSDSRLAADRWDRLLLDGFVANQLTSYLLRRAR